MSHDTALYEEEPCRYCDGDGCEACNDTGLAYTENAIRLQIEVEEERGERPA